MNISQVREAIRTLGGPGSGRYPKGSSIHEGGTGTKAEHIQLLENWLKDYKENGAETLLPHDHFAYALGTGDSNAHWNSPAGQARIESGQAHPAWEKMNDIMERGLQIDAKKNYKFPGSGYKNPQEYIDNGQGYHDEQEPVVKEALNYLKRS
jgi:hypothetical protein